MANDERFPAGSWFRTHTVRLIGSDGAEIGVVTIAEALQRASDAGLKLVEINTSVDPAVLRMMDEDQYLCHLAATQGSVN